MWFPASLVLAAPARAWQPPLLKHTDKWLLNIFQAGRNEWITGLWEPNCKLVKKFNVKWAGGRDGLGVRGPPGV